MELVINIVSWENDITLSSTNQQTQPTSKSLYESVLSFGFHSLLLSLLAVPGGDGILYSN